MTKKKKMSREEKIFHVIMYPIFGLFFFVCAYPFYYLLICTISDGSAVDLGKVLFWPKGINFTNYVKIITVNNLANSAIVSVSRVVIGTVLQLLVCSYVAYFFTKQNMWGRKFWYRMTAITMYFSAGMIPMYLNYKMLGLLNTFWVYVIPGALSVYNMILIKTNIEALPQDLEESAYLDGAGYFTRFFRIVLPLIKPILATIALFSAVSHWNDFFCTKMYITEPELYTLQFLLYELLNQIRALTDLAEFSYAAITPMGVRMTLTAVVMIPIMLVYPFIQKYYIKGMLIGAVKG